MISQHILLPVDGHKSHVLKVRAQGPIQQFAAKVTIQFGLDRSQLAIESMFMAEKKEGRHCWTGPSIWRIAITEPVTKPLGPNTGSNDEEFGIWTVRAEATFASSSFLVFYCLYRAIICSLFSLGLRAFDLIFCRRIGQRKWIQLVEQLTAQKYISTVKLVRQLLCWCKSSHVGVYLISSC